MPLSSQKPTISCQMETDCTSLQTDNHTNTHTHPFNGPLSGTTRVNRYQKGNANLDFTEARDSEWQWHQLGHMQVCTSLQTDNHTSTPPLSFYRPDALPAAQPTASKHCRHITTPTVNTSSLNCYRLHALKSRRVYVYDTRCYFNVRSKADISQLNLPLEVCVCVVNVNVCVCVLTVTVAMLCYR